VLAPPAIALLVTLAMALFFAALDLRLALALVAYLALAGIGVPLLTRRLGSSPARARSRPALTSAPRWWTACRACRTSSPMGTRRASLTRSAL